MAHGMFAQALAPRGITVESAGLGAMVGYPADPCAVRACATIGVDLSAHQARQVTEEMVTRADLVFVMEQYQRFKIMERYPFATGRTFMLAAKDIEDPYQLPPEAFELARDQIRAAVDSWVARLV